MSRTVDERIVSMQFDNRQFENNVKTSMGTLERLKQSLNLSGAAKGLDSVNESAKRIDLSGLGRGVETVHAKFSALQIMGITALTNITNSAVNAGKRIASALTIEPIKTGLQEYETQINAVQTILANTSSKGTTLQDVNNALDTLNTYADKTIYNFTEMTRNIGTFTAAGVDLDTSVSAIQGIANLAAVSGSTSQQASTAMYQLSQALAAGKVSLMDWNSVVNAGMGGQVFQDALKRTSEVMGTGAEKAIKKYGSFRESLTKGEWLTTDVLTKTLEQFTMAAEEGSEEWNNFKKTLRSEGYTEKQAVEILKMANTATDAATKVKTLTQLWDTLKESAQSGWTQTWEILVGDFEESKEMWTKVSDTIGEMINNSSNSRNEMLTGAFSSGWKQLLAQGIDDEEGFKDSIKSVAKEHKVNFDKMIEDTGSFEKALKKGLGDGTITSDMLSESVHKLGDKIRGMSEKERKAAGYTKEHLTSIEALESGLEKGTISMDEFVKKMSRPSGRELVIESVANAFNGIMSVIKPVKEAFREVFPPITSEQLYKLLEGIRDITTHFRLSADSSEKLKKTFKGLFSVVRMGIDFIIALGKGVFSLLSNFTGFGGSILDVTSAIGEWLTKLRESTVQGNIFEKVVSKVVDIINGGIGKIKEFGKYVKETFASNNYEGFIGFLKAIWNIISSIGSGLTKALSSIGSGIADAFNEGSFFDVLTNGALVGILLKVGTFISALTEKIGEPASFLENIISVLDDVRGCFEQYQNNLKAGSLQKIAIAIGVLTAAIFVLSTIDGDALAKALFGITILFGELVGSLYLLQTMGGGKFGGVIKSIGLMTGVSIAITILAGALKILSTIDTEGLIKGLVAVGILMFEISIFLSNYKMEGKLSGTALGMVILSGAIVILSNAVKNFSNMSWKDIGKGLASIGALLLELGIFTKLAGNTKHMFSIGVGLVILGASIKIFASSMKDFIKMKWEDIGKGLASIGGALTIVAIATNMMPKNMLGIGIGLTVVSGSLLILYNALKDMAGFSIKEIGTSLIALGGSLTILAIGLHAMNGTIAGSASLLVAAAALNIMVPVMNKLGNMSWIEIGKGLIVLAGAFTVIGVAGYLLAPVVPAILGLAASFALLGIASLAIGAGLSLAAVGLTAFSVAGTVAATAIVASLTVIITGILDLIPTIIGKFGEIITAFCVLIGETAPQIAEALVKLIAEVLKTLVTYTPQIISSLSTIIIQILDGLGEYIPQIIQSAVNFLGKVFDGIIQALNGIDSTNLIKTILMIGLLDGIMVALSTTAGFIPGAMIAVLGLGALIAELAIVLAAIGGLAQIPGLEWLIKEGGDFLQKIGTAIGQFIGGIVGGIAKGITSSLPAIATDLSSFMLNLEPFIDGASTIDTSLVKGIASLAEAILIITAANVINGIGTFLSGGSSLADFSKQITEFGKGMKEYADSVSGIDVDVIKNSATAAQALSELASNLPNSGGIVSWFTGNNDISDFGDMLTTFGKGMKSYSESISGIDPVAIVASSIAAESLSELANKLPNSGGLISWFTGNNDISNFGDMLIPFGEGMKSYSESISGIDPESVSASATAAKALAELADNLPNSGGIVSWFTGDNKIGDFGKMLIPFGKGMKEYGESVEGIDPIAVEASATAAKALAELADNLPNSGGIVSWFTGDNEIGDFGKQLVPFAKGMKKYSDAISGIDSEAITASAIAAKSLAELANSLPNNDGIVSWFTGDNKLDNFGETLVPFGKGMKEYSDAISGLDADAVTSSANAAKALAELANNLPNTGNIVTFFTGENTNLATFGQQLIPFGEAMKGYSDAISGIDIEAVTASSNAAKALSEIPKNLPNVGGLASLFVGESSLLNFGEQLAPFGKYIKDYADSIQGIDVTAVEASTNAAKTLAELANNLPNAGNLLTLFTGENTNLALFGQQLVPFGKGMKSYSDAITGINPDLVTGSATAAKSLVELSTGLQNSGGLLSYFTGDNHLGLFAEQLTPFGTAMKSYSDSITGIDPELITNSATAATSLAELATKLQNTGGLIALFTGDSNLGIFAEQLTPFGTAMKSYSDSISGINPELITSSATAAQAIVDVGKTLSNSGGMLSFFTGEQNLGTFGEQLVPFGKGMKNYSDAVAEVKPGAISLSVESAQKLIELTSTLENSGGLFEWFTGKKDLGSLGESLVPFGNSLKRYSDSVAGIDVESIKNSASATKSLTKVCSNLSDIKHVNGEAVGKMVSNLVPLGRSMKSYSNTVSGVNIGAISSSVSAAKKLVELINSMSGLKTGGVLGFKDALSTLASVEIEKFINTFSKSSEKLNTVGARMIENLIKGVKSKDSEVKSAMSNLAKTAIQIFNNKRSDFKTSGVKLITGLISGITSQKSKLSSSMTSSLSSAVSKIRAKRSSFYNAGTYLGEGLVSGINSKKQAAYNAGYALGQKAVQGEKDGQKSNSPSKLTIQSGKWLGEGLIIGINQMGKSVYKAGYNIGESATKSISGAISRVSEIMNSDIDTQPTIRPVMDLSEVRAGANSISSLFNTNQSVGVLANVSGISSMMNRRNQNGSNDDVISAIKDLGKSMSNTPSNTYTINGITYDDGSNVARAITEIVRAARIEGRS